MVIALVLLLLATPAWASPEQITATENERLRAYAEAIKNDRDQKEAELSTLKLLLEKAQRALIEQQKMIERLQGGREQ